MSAEPDQMITELVSAQALHCLLIKCTFNILMELTLTTKKYLNSKWIPSIDKGEKIH